MFFFLNNCLLYFCSSYWEVWKRPFCGILMNNCRYLLQIIVFSLFECYFSAVRCYVRNNLTAGCERTTFPSFLDNFLPRSSIYLAVNAQYLCPDPT